VAPVRSGPADPYTVDDLATVPDDGRCHELIDGVLLTSPAPSWSHTRTAARVCILLATACPDGMEVLVPPMRVRRHKSTEVQPDVLVAHVTDLTPAYLPVPPVLAVEVVSPVTALLDRHLKRAVYESMGCPAYWILDPDEPSLQVLELDGHGRYAERATLTDGRRIPVTRPFPVIVSLVALGVLRAVAPAPVSE
jgi:Uma2 family endonuclease